MLDSTVSIDLDTADGFRIRVNTLGSKPSVLLVHGAAATATTWKRLMPALKAVGISSAAIDLRGHGASGGAERLQQFGLDEYVRDVETALHALPTLRCLVGHSMGGLVCQLAAERNELHSLVLIASSPVFGMRRDGIRMFSRHPSAFFRSGLRRSFRDLYRSANTTRSLLFHPNTDEAVVREFMTECQEESWRAGNEMKTRLPNFRKITCLVKVIAGSDDFMVSRASSVATASAYAVPLSVIERCGHMVPYEADQMRLAAMVAGDA